MSRICARPSNPSTSQTRFVVLTSPWQASGSVWGLGKDGDDDGSCNSDDAGAVGEANKPTGIDRRIKIKVL